MEQRWAQRGPRRTPDRQRWAKRGPRKGQKESPKCGRARQIQELVQARAVEQILKRCWTDVDGIQGQRSKTCGQCKGRNRTKMEQRWAKRGPRWTQDRQGWTTMRPKEGRRSPKNVAVAGRFGISCRFGLLTTWWTLVEQMLSKRQARRGAKRAQIWP